MSNALPREWRFYLDDMILFAGKVLTYTRGLDQAAFLANGLVFDAALRNLELIGEAALKIPDTVRQAESQIPWRLIIATRNRLIHGYLGIDNSGIGGRRVRRRSGRQGMNRHVNAIAGRLSLPPGCRRGDLSTSKAAELAGLTYAEFLEAAVQRNAVLYDYDSEEVKAELSRPLAEGVDIEPIKQELARARAARG